MAGVGNDPRAEATEGAIADAPAPAATRSTVLGRLKASYHWSARVLLGRGSYGKVFLAMERESGGARAIKVVSIDRDPEWSRGTQCEEWRHPNIVRFFNVLMPDLSNPQDKHCAFAMQAADSDMHSFILKRRSPGVPREQAREISLQCTRGLVFLHDKEVLHRDLKPGNVLLFFRAAPSHVAGTCRLSLQACLADFGFARRQTAGMTPFVQTPGYRAPEIILAQENADEGEYTSAIGVWSLGCIFYELVVGDRFGVAEQQHASIAMLVSALGPCPNVAPWNSHPAFELFQRKPTDESRLISSMVGEEWQAITKCLCWLPGARSSGAALLEEPWFVLATTQDMVHHLGEGQSHDQTALVVQSLAVTEVLQSQTVTEIDSHAEVAASGADASAPSAAMVRCSCAGHCYTPGHRTACPPCGQMVPRRGLAKVFCTQCRCLAGLCDRPRLRGLFCSMHSRTWRVLPSEVQALVATQGYASELLVPCDVEDMLSLAPMYGDHLALMLCLAWMKEPVVRKEFLEHLGQVDGLTVYTTTTDKLIAALRKTCLAVDAWHKEGDERATVHRTQMHQLGRSGEARTCGFASFCRIAGVTKTHKAGVCNNKAKRLRLNLEGSDYVFCDEAGVFFDRLLAATQECADLPKVVDEGNLDATITQLHNFVAKAVSARGRVEEHVGYLRSFLMRCLLMARCGGRVSQSFQWAQVSVATIVKAVPDQREVLSAFPSDWFAAEVSSFCWGRSDWIWMVPIFGCLWGKLASKHGKDIVLLAAAQEFCDAAAAFRRQHGFSAHPGALVEGFGRDASAWPAPPYATFLPRAGS